jgi:F0F1-type ATP synthase assembly protein I
MSNASPWRHVFAGTVFAITLMVAVFGGLWCDHRWSISPWGTLAGAVVGFIVGIYNLMREFKDDFNS